ncbi:MAG: hypothetical protein R3A52_30910 [Polyangiales bacterium]
MTMPLLDLPTDPEIAEARAALGRRLYEVISGLGSQRAAWEALHEAGLFPDSVGRYYASVRKIGLEATLDALFEPSRLDLLRRFVEDPRPAALPRVSVSSLANQFYCEMQVHLARSHSLRTESAALAAGTAGHAALEADAEEITAEEIDRALAAGEDLELVEMPLSAEVDGVRLVGRADRVHLKGKRALLVLEFKFSSRRELFPSHIVQVEAYGRMLEANGYRIDQLLHGVAVLPRGQKVSDALAQEIATRATDAAKLGLSAGDSRPPSGFPDPLRGLATRRIDHDAFGLWVFRHSRARVERDLGWALGYWTDKRKPVGTPSRGKCRACPFNAASLCTEAKAPPDGRYDVRRTEGRYGVLHVVQPSRPR